MSTCAIIPARGGSKRLPRKNVLPFGGRPMLTWTVDAALHSGEFAAVFVSTDDDEIAEVAAQAGAQVLRRPAALADDQTSLGVVLRHAVQEALGDYVSLCMLLANCPLRNGADIRASAALYRERAPAALLSVCDYLWTPPFRALSNREGSLQPLFGDWVRRKSQDYPAALCPSGALYWTSPATVEAADGLYVDGLAGFEMPWHRAIDIDTQADFELASALKLALDHGFEFTG